jgi:hypothetical protein
MAVKRFLVDIDLSKNQLLNAVLQNLATPPSSPSEGQMYYDTTDDTAYIWDGTQWLDLAKLQNASEVPFTPTGNTLSTNVQAAIEELQTEIDTISGSSGTGDTYVVTVAGNFFTEAVQVGDMVIAKENSANTLAKWSVVNKNIPDIVDASETTKGIVELATQAEVDAGTDTTRAITPATLAGSLGVTGTLTSALTYTATIGDNTSTSIAVTHNIGRPVQTQVYKVTTGEEVGCEIVNTNTNVVTLKFNIAPTTAELRVVIAG